MNDHLITFLTDWVKMLLLSRVRLFATPWTPISSFIFLRWLLESRKLPWRPVLSFVVPSPSQPFMRVPQTWAEGHAAADLCELGICLLADPIPPFLQEGLVRSFEASAEGLTLLGHMGVAHGESDLNNSLFFLLLLSLPLPVIVLLFLTSSLASLHIFLIPLSLINFLPYFSGPQVGDKLPTLPSDAAHLSPPGEQSLCLCLWGSLSQLIKELAACMVMSCPGQPALQSTGLLPSFLTQTEKVRPTGSPNWGPGKLSPSERKQANQGPRKKFGRTECGWRFKKRGES